MSLRSSKKGFFRYWTPTIKKKLKEHSEAESKKESALKSILQRLGRHFCEHHNQWRLLVSAAAELDVLIGLAIASDFYEGPTCRPVILGSSSSNNVPCFSAKGLGHPVLRSDSWVRLFPMTSLLAVLATPVSSFLLVLIWVESRPFFAKFAWL